MRHVDEGLLHAYIDGAFEAGSPERDDIEAHLAACADCRVRLDDARRIRDVAQDVLDAAAPAAATPPAWDTIVAEHAKRKAGGGVVVPAPARIRPRIPLAWAATVVLALGAGWMARVMVAEAPMREAAMSADVVESDALSEAAPPAAALPATPQEAQPGARPDASAEQRQRFADEDRARTRPVTPLAERRDAAADERAEAAKAAAPPPAASNLGRAAIAADAVAGLMAFSNTPLGVAADSAATRWVVSDADAVSAIFGQEPVTVEGLTADTLQLASVAGMLVARSVFVLADGVVELLQRPAVTTQAAPVQEAEAGGGSATHVVRGIEVLVRGTSAAAIEEVRSRLR